MKQKRVMVLVLTILIISLISILSAADSENADAEKAYTCLKNNLNGNNCTSRNVQLTAFNLMAIAYDSDLQSKCKSSLISKKTSENCWPSTEGGSCDIKSTAISILSLIKIEENVEKSINWTLGKKRLETGLIWYLEIDTPNSSTCDINGRPVFIGENKKIISGSPEGLERSYGNYWFKIKDINKNYTIFCDKPIITSLLYQKPSGNVYYVSSNPHSASAGDSVTEKVESYCFGGSSCDYESSLWATLALAKYKIDISPYLPYIYSMSEDIDKQKYLPSAFLLMLTGMAEYESDLKSKQKEGKYWGERATALDLSPFAISALIQGNSGDSTEVKDSEKYILSLQDKSTGCWSDDKTSYILSMIWPKNAVTTSSSTPGTTPMTCEERTYSCVPSTRCNTNDQESGYECSGFAEICCKNPIPEQTCEEQGGTVCGEGEVCSQPTTETIDKEDCCLTKECSIEQTEQDPCPISTSGYSCKARCSTDEQFRSTLTCSGDIQCCYKEPITSGSNLWLIILLIILIILVILAIIFRNQLQIWWFRIKNNVSSKKGPPPTSRPGVSQPFRPVPQRPIVQRPENRRLMPMRRTGEKDKEFEDTMKKLRDMSK